MNAREKWEDDEIDIVTREYEINPKVYDLLPNRTRRAVNVKARRLGLSWNGRGKIRFNPYFFDSYSEDSAYVLGFIAADGSITRNYITISQSDITILEKIAAVMGFEQPYPIWKTSDDGTAYVCGRLVNCKPGYTIRVTSKHMSNRLRDIGICENKSYKLGKVNIDARYLKDFVRGFNDGDGSISMGAVTNNSNNHTIRVSMDSTYNFLNWLQGYIHMTTGLPRRKIQHRPDSYAKVLNYNGRNAVLLLKWIYSDNPELYLERKKAVFDKYLDCYPDRGEYLYNMPCPGSKHILLGEDIVQ